jgi:Flp pilus assembly protein TadG
MGVIATLRRLWRDQAGAALAELVIVMPFMMLLLMGFAEALQLVEAHRRVSRAASAIGDLAAQEQTLSRSELNELFLLGGLLMDPLPRTTLGARLMSFSADNTGRVSLDWVENGSAAYGGSAPQALPAGYGLMANQSVMVADVSYTYKPGVRWILPADIKLQKRMLLRPRASDRVTLEGA